MPIELEMIQDENATVAIQERGIGCAGATAPPDAGHLARFICHDLRLPLNSILAYSELLAGNNLDTSEREDFHHEICLAVRRMNDLISLLLESSKGLEGSRSEIASIADTVQAAVKSVAVRREFRNITIRCDHQGLVQGLFDPGQMHQVISNVVLNACEAVSPTMGRIWVRSHARRDGMEISVSDNGPGIPEAIRHAVFEPFVSFGKAGGTGLGLAIVQKILRDQGGEIFLDATGDEGTHFRLVLPYANARRGKPTTSNARRRLKFRPFSIEMAWNYWDLRCPGSKQP